jgi:2-polyprenyl-6-methoxyphenol hydroxylase-like FAD-dependent oxidoreductase
VAMFPIGAGTRANLFVYRDMQDPWLKEFREAPKETLLKAMPHLESLTGAFEVDGFVKIRPVDLYVSEGHRQAGVVLVGDAFATSCPAAGTGAGKALMDVGRLCNEYIPRWLETPGMGAEKIAAFYDDRVKRAYDAFCTRKAYFLRSFSIDTGPYWTAQRWGKFAAHWLRGALRKPFLPQAVEAPSLVPAQAPDSAEAYTPARVRHTV